MLVLQSIQLLQGQAKCILVATLIHFLLFCNEFSTPIHPSRGQECSNHFLIRKDGRSHRTLHGSDIIKILSILVKIVTLHRL